MTIGKTIALNIWTFAPRGTKGGWITGEGAGRGQARLGGSACCSCPRAPPLPPSPRSHVEPSSRANQRPGASGRQRHREGPDARTWPRQPPWRTAAPAPEPGSGGPGPRVYFQSPPGAAGEGPGGSDNKDPVRPQGKVTVKYDRKELRKRLNLEEWILEQLTRLYDCQVCPPPCADTLNLFRFGPPGNPTLSPPVTRRQWASSLSALPCSLYSPPPMYALSCLT